MHALTFLNFVVIPFRAITSFWPKMNHRRILEMAIKRAFWNIGSSKTGLVTAADMVPMISKMKSLILDLMKCTPWWILCGFARVNKIRHIIPNEEGGKRGEGKTRRAHLLFLRIFPNEKMDRQHIVRSVVLLSHIFFFLGHSWVA